MDMLDDHKYTIDGPVVVRNITDFSAQLQNSYEEDNVVDKFEEIFVPRSNLTVYMVVNCIWILRSIYREKVSETE